MYNKNRYIQQLVTLQSDVEKIKNDQKTAVRRNNRYGEIGDILQFDSHTFTLKNAYEQKLGEMTEENAKEEGFENMQQYKERILSIHQNMKWDPEVKVWVRSEEHTSELQSRGHLVCSLLHEKK